MNRAIASQTLHYLSLPSNRLAYLLPSFLAGLLIPFGFAPFHWPGLSILGIALFVGLLQQKTPKESFYSGFVFGLGFFGLGVSWIYVSIHEYGHLNWLTSTILTLFFIFYLALYPALVALFFNKLATKRSILFSCFLFSALWCLSEIIRARFLSGFPWLSMGFGQTNTPIKYLIPIFGIYGGSFFTCLAATFLAAGIQTRATLRYLWIIAFVTILLIPSILKNKEWASIEAEPISVGIIQANLSMRDKWDESLFWQLMQRYDEGLKQLIGKNKLIVMPESAIPLPPSFIRDFLDEIHFQAQDKGSAVLLGTIQPTSDDEEYHNAMISLGLSNGTYLKQHLVPFGEFIPRPFQRFIHWLALPSTNLKPGEPHQRLIEVLYHPIATLICYELAYPQLLRQQLPMAKWIVSISDDGWFGRSFAPYQHLQMAQALSLQTARYQVLANNDGLSSIINSKGDIIASLPAFHDGMLESKLYPASGASPWVYFGDAPILLLSCLIILLALLARCSSMLNFKIF